MAPDVDESAATQRITQGVERSITAKAVTLS